MKTLRKALTGSEHRGLTSLVLRTAATAALVLDCVYIAGMGRPWMEGMRWIAYPVFAYLLAEGVEKSSSLKLYARRLILFTLLAEPAYDLLRFGNALDWRSQSPMLCLLIGFLCLALVEWLRKRFDNLVVTGAAELAAAFGGTWIAARANAMFAAYGIYIIVILYVARHLSYSRLFELAVALLFLINITNVSYVPVMISGLQYAVPIQSFLLVAMLLIWAYNGERGPNSRALRLCFYASYPVMLLAAALIRLYLQRSV